MAARGSSRVPERWTDYLPLGCRMPGTRFIAFKVPLNKSFDQNLMPEERFSPHDLIRKVKERKEELGLIIDLTCTTRYYGREELPPTLRYSKILTMGHKIPNRKTILRFKYLVKKFLTANKDNDKLIGVHCTHGLNRTGYLVCRYLIDIEGMEPNAAIELFNKSRGHSIERINYIQDLRKRALKNCELKNLGSDRFRKSDSGKPQKQLVKQPQHRPSQKPLAVPRSPGSTKKKQWPGPVAQGQPQELGHRYGALGQGQLRNLEQKQLKKLEQRQSEKQQRKLEENHLEQKQLEQLEQKQQEKLEQRQWKKLEQKQQNHPEQKQRKKLEQNHLEQKQWKKLEKRQQNHLEQNHLEQKPQNHLECLEQRQRKKLEQKQQNHAEQKQQKKLEHLEQKKLEKRQQNHLEQNHLEQRQQKKLEHLEQNNLEYLEQRQQKKLEKRQKLEQNHVDYLKQKQHKKLEKRQQHLEQNHLEQNDLEYLEQKQHKKLEKRQHKKLQQHHLEQHHLEYLEQKQQNHLEQKQQRQQNHLEQRQPCSLAPKNCWLSSPPKKKHKELFLPQSPQPCPPQEPSPARKRQRRKHKLGEQEMS